MLVRCALCALLLFCAAPQPGFCASRAPLHDPKVLAREILSNHRLYRLEVSLREPPPSLLQRAVTWASRAIARILEPIFTRTRLPAELLTRAGEIFLILALVGLGRLLTRLRLRRRMSGPVAQSSPLPSRVSAAELYAQGCAACEHRDYVAALARLFQAALSSLAEARVLDATPSATVGEYRSAVQRGKPLALSAFDTIARGLTQAIYAERPITRGDWDEARAAYLSLQQQVAR